ncbi:MAG: GAF domain-containing protein [archaeon]
MNRTRTAAVGIVALGVVLAAIQLLRWPTSSPAAVYTSLPFVLISLALAYSGWWLSRTDQYEADADRVLLWTVGAGVTFGAIAVLVQLVPNDPARSGLVRSPVWDTLTAGALAGALVGLYDAQSRERLEALEAERDRIDTFAHKAKSLNHYGKALNQSRSVFEVSALAIEVLELLIGSRDAAVVLVEDDTTLLDSTVAAGTASFLRRTAERVSTADGMECVHCPADVSCSIPADVGAEAVVAVPIPTESGATFVIMALLDADDRYSEEDVDLLESLAAHVGTALSQVDIDAARADA